MENGRPRGDAKRIALPVSGDDPKAKAVVMKLIHDLGFDAVDAGSLDESWRQPGTLLYTTDHNSEDGRRGLNLASSQHPREFQALEKSPGTYAKPA